MESKYTLKIRINQSERTERDMEQKRMKKTIQYIARSVSHSPSTH